MAPRGEGRLVPIPPRVRAIAPPALPVRIFGLALLLALALMVGAKPAAAKTPCWKQVVQDWFEDSTIDRTYPRHCYSDALKNVPNDVKDYSSFEEDIRSALQRVSRARTLANTGSGASTQPEKPTQRPGSADEVVQAEPRTGVLQASVRQAGPARGRLDAGPAHDHGRIGSPARRRGSRRADYAPLPGQASRPSGHVEPDSGPPPELLEFAGICSIRPTPFLA